MMTCKHVTERASDLIDGNLGLWETLRIRLHLAICRGCERFIAQMRVTRDLTRAACVAEAADSADDARVDAILSRVHDAKRPGG